jgi:hypothetical protein
MSTRRLGRTARALTCALACALACAAPSRAQDGAGGWVVSGFVGGAGTSSSDLRVAQPELGTDVTFGDLRFEGRSFQGPLYYGARGGYFFPNLPSLGVEAELIHMKVYSDPSQVVRALGVHRGAPIAGELPLGSIVQGYSISHGANFLLFNVVGRHGFGRDAGRPDGRLVVSGRFGAGPTIPHTESTIDGERREQYELGRLGWQLAAGAEVQLWRGLYALGEYKLTRTRQRGDVFAGEAESLLRSHHGVFGLTYHF